MAVGSRRTRFAASFVAVVAGGSCAHDKRPIESWTVFHRDAQCFASQVVDCPSGASCNPPPPLAIACPAGFPPSNPPRIVSFDGAHCVIEGTNEPLACPSYENQPLAPPTTSAAAPDASATAESIAPGAPAAPAPIAAADGGRGWRIVQGDQGCFAEQIQPLPCTPGPACDPPAATQVSCPPFHAGDEVREVAPGNCQTTIHGSVARCPPGYRCNPPPPRIIAVPCPS